MVLRPVTEKNVWRNESSNHPSGIVRFSLCLISIACSSCRSLHFRAQVIPTACRSVGERLDQPLMFELF